MYRTKRWHRLRQKALTRDGYRCTCCGADVCGPKKARVDHIQSVKEAPALAWELQNLRTLCAACDNKRHSVERGGGVEPQTISVDGFPVNSEWSCKVEQ